jgi:hypothetical protein
MRSRFNLGIKLSAGLLFTFVFHTPSFAQAIPKSECRSGYGQTACGYNCISANGKVRCAEWPGGTCKAAYDDVVCGPAAPAGWQGENISYFSNLPQSECYSANGKTVCGYNCTSAFGDVGCAEWPGGTCKPSGNGVTCGPAAPENWFVKYSSRERPYYRRYYYYPDLGTTTSVVKCVRDLIDLGVSEDNAAIACSQP